jgi:hypothetical protein
MAADNQGQLGFEKEKPKTTFLIDYQAEDLFGGDDAGFVTLPLLQSYSVKRDDCVEFLNEKNPFMILCAPKGTGKTTICRLWENELSRRPGYVSIIRFDITISPRLVNASLTEWIYAWKKTIADAILLKLTEDSGTVVRTVGEMLTEREYRSNRAGQPEQFAQIAIAFFESNKNLLGDIDFDKLQLTLSKFKDKKIWFFLDEIDQYFVKDEQSIRKVAGMLIAAREISSYISNLSIRTTIKPTVWAVLRSNIASMATIQSLIVRLEWTKEGIRSVIAKRIESYLERNNLFSGAGSLFEDDIEAREDWYIGKVFLPEKFDLGKGNRKPHITLARLGIYRPRWVLDLCKNTVQKTGRNGHLIEFKDVQACMVDFGSERIKDISTEYAYQCPQISSIIYAFLNSKSSYKLYDLISLINDKILSKITVEIIGLTNEANGQQVASFLYEIGFVEGKKLEPSGKYEFFRFKDHPTLVANQLLSEKVLTDLYWEVEPAFRDVLYLSKPTNKEIMDKKSRHRRRKK